MKYIANDQGYIVFPAKKRQLFFERKNLLKRGDLTLHSLGKDADILCRARFFDNAAIKNRG
jgi:hypothetical protein